MPPAGVPRVLCRTHRYNRVSFGALLAAWAGEALPPVVIWDHLQPLPAGLGEGPVLACYSYMMPHEPDVATELRWLREQVAAPVTALAGGPQVTLDAERALLLGFDAVLAGEAETEFRRHVEAWLAGTPLSGILPNTDPRPDLERFSGFHRCMGYLPPIEITRGCAFACAFCTVPQMYHGQVRHRSIDQIARIAAQYVQLGRARIKFLTPNAFAYGSTDGRTPNPAAVGGLMKALRAVGVPEIHFGSFPGEVRPDFVTPAMIDAVRPYVKNRTMVLGAQSGDDEILAKLNRRHTAAQVREAVRLIAESGITPHVDFIIGFPWETPDDQRRLLDFMESLVADYRIRIHFHHFMPLPRAPLGRERARPIHPSVRPRIKALQRAGVLDGWWENQRDFSKRPHPSDSDALSAVALRRARSGAAAGQEPTRGDPAAGDPAAGDPAAETPNTGVTEHRPLHPR